MKEEEMVDSLSLPPYTFQAINVLYNASSVQLYSLYFILASVGYIYFLVCATRGSFISHYFCCLLAC